MADSVDDSAKPASLAAVLLPRLLTSLLLQQNLDSVLKKALGAQSSDRVGKLSSERGLTWRGIHGPPESDPAVLLQSQRWWRLEQWVSRSSLIARSDSRQRSGQNSSSRRPPPPFVQADHSRDDVIAEEDSP